MTSTPKGDQGNLPGAGVGDDGARAFLADGAALGFSAMATALVGLLGWLLAARLLDPAQVGRASAFVNAFVFVAGVAELGLGQASLKWLPQAGHHTRTILLRVLGGVLTSSVLAALLWGLLFHDDLAFQLDLEPVAAVAVFVVASVGWTVLHAQNLVLTAAGGARWVPVEMLSFGVVRIVLLVVLAPPYGALGIVVSWVLPTAVAAVVVPSVLALRRHRRDDLPGVVPDRRSTVRTAGSIWLSTFGTTLTLSLVPVVVTDRFGPSVGAAFFIVWNGVAAVELAAAGFGSALVVRLSGPPADVLGRSLRQVLPVFAAALLVAALAATPLLSLFGSAYADEGVGLLRWVCGGLLFRLVGIMIAGIHLSDGRTLRLFLTNAAPAVALLSVSPVIPTGSGLTALGAAYFGVQLIVVVVAVLDLLVGSRRWARPTGAVPGPA